jgi:outer membrane protein TolC
MQISKFFLLFFFFPIIAFSITFEEALEKTLQNNKSLKAKKLEIQTKELDLLQVKGKVLGSLEFQENISRSNNPLHTFGMKLGSRETSFADFGFDEFLNSSAMRKIMANDTGVTNTDMAKLLATQPEKLNNPEERINYETKLIYQIPIFTGFKLESAKKMADLQVDASKAKYNHDTKQLALEVLKAYNGAVAANYFIIATQKAKEATNSFVHFASSLYKEGLVTNIDVQQASVYDMHINSLLLEAQNKYALALAYLKFLTNDNSIEKVEDFKSIKTSNLTLQSLQENAIQQRDDLQWMETNTQTMKKKIAFEESENYPMIGAHIEYGFNDDELSNIDNSHDYLTAAIGLQYKIFDGFSASTNIEKAKVEYAKTKHYLQYMQDGIKLEVEKAHLTLKTKQSVLKEKIKAQKLADEVLRKSQEMYKNQLMKMSDLLMQQANAQKARAEVIMAKYEATIAAAKLQLSIGNRLQ